MRRRENGEGTTYRRKDGRWCAQTPYPERKTFYGETAAEAIRRRARYLATSGRISKASDTRPLSEFLAAWLATKRPSIRESTAIGYAQHIEKWIVPAIGTIPLGKIRPRHVQEVINQAIARAPRTVRNIRRTLHQALGYAVALGLIPSNPAGITSGAVIIPKAPKVEYELLSDAEMKAWRAYLATSPHRALALMYTDAALRLGEALALRWRDVDVEAGTITVSGSLRRVGGRLVINAPKTDAGRRTIRLGTRRDDGSWHPDSAIVALRQRRIAQMEDRMAAGGGWAESDLVFTTRMGTPMEPRNVARLFQVTMMPGAGIASRGIHQLRHTAITTMLRRNVPIKAVQHFAGHSSAQMTLDLYGHYVADMGDLVAGAIEAGR